MYKIEFTGNRGSLLVEHAEESKSGKTLKLVIGKCTCYKNTCDCVQYMQLDKRLVKHVENLDEVKEGYLRCAGCGDLVPKNKIFEAKDGKNHLCFYCY